MRRLQLAGLGLSLVVMFAVAAVLASSAVALPSILPSFNETRTWAGNKDGSANPELVGAERIVCTSAPANGTREEREKALGLFHIEFRGCTSLGGLVSCKGLGEAAGVILSLGTWHLVYDTLTPVLGVATLFLTEPVHIECATVLVQVSGKVLCLDLEPTSEKVTHLFHCNQSGRTQEEREYWDDNGTKLSAELLCIEGGRTQQCAELALAEWGERVATVTDNV